MVTACSGGGGSSYDAVTGPSPSSTPSPTQSGDRVGAISANHGHVAVIESALLMAGGAVALTIDGSADHGHSVTLTAEQVSQIAGGARVARISSTAAVRADDGYGTGGAVAPHDHTVTFN